jgi:hypothetical protein
MRRGILASRDELTALRERIGRKPFDGIYDALRRRCALMLETAPVTEAHWRSLWEHGQWGSAVTAARTAQGRIMDLLIAHHIDRNAAYRDRAAEELQSLISWSTWVDPCHNHLPADLCTAEAAVAAAVGLDWLWEDLPEADRLGVLQAIRHKAIAPYRKAVQQQAWWYSCYHNWNAVVNSGCGLAGLALGDEDPVAQEVYQLAMAGLKHFFDALGREGGWDEGLGYWGYAMRYLLLLGEAADRLLDDQRIFHQRGMDATGLFPVYFTPNGQPASFGDNPVVPLYGALYLLVKHFGQPEVTRWLDTYAFHRDVAATGWASEGLALLFRPVEAELLRRAADAPKLQQRGAGLAPVKVFHEIGWAAMADRWPRPSMYVAVKTGDLAAHHAQRDMNSIQFQLDGEMLLIDLGHGPFSREYFSDARSEFYEVQARAHNTITVGQRDHQIDARGEIVEDGGGENFRWVAADAETACGDNVRFVRHAVMIVEPSSQEGQMLIVLDELTDTEREEADLTWHTDSRLQLDAQKMTGTITGFLSEKAAVHFALAACGEPGRTADSKAAAVEIAEPNRTETPGAELRRPHNILHLAAPIDGKLVLASVFSRQPLGQPVRIVSGDGGEILLHAGAVTLEFKPAKDRLHLQHVAAWEGKT